MGRSYNALVLLGAEARQKVLHAEIEELRKELVDLEAICARLRRAPFGKPDQLKGKPGRKTPMSRKEKAEVSARMKRYWASQRGKSHAKRLKTKTVARKK